MICRRIRRKIAAKIVVLTAVVWAMPALGQTATFSAPAAESGWWLATGLGTGAVSPDQNLADFRWDTRPATQYALQAITGHGRWAGGLRYSRWATTQGTGLDQADPDPRVQLKTLELVGQVRLVELAGFEFWGTAAAGRVDLSYTPDQLTIATGTAAGDITVNYEPITETSLGFGLEIRRNFSRSLTAALQAERSGFSLDTSHRRGTEIVLERQKFANWSLRIQMAWVVNLG